MLGGRNVKDDDAGMLNPWENYHMRINASMDQALPLYTVSVMVFCDLHPEGWAGPRDGRRMQRREGSKGTVQGPGGGGDQIDL